MNSMINLGNLGAPQASPAAQGLAGQTASQGDSSSLFSALLMQHIGPNLSNTGNAEALQDPEQNFPASAELAKLLPTLLAQTKDPKSAVPVNRQTDNPAPGPDDNPALAMWIASIAAMQMQPNVQAPPAQLNALSQQLGNSGADQNPALQALEQQFPGLVHALSNHFADGKSQTGKASAKMIGPDAKPADVNPADVKAAGPKTADTKTADIKAAFDSALNAAQTVGPQKSDVQQAPVHVNADVAPVAQKVVAASDKSKVDPKSQMTAVAEKANQPQLTPVAPQVQDSGAKPQGQSQPQSGDNHSNNQAKKDSASTTQGQPTANQANGAASIVPAAMDQSNFSAMTQVATHSVPANTPNHPVSSDSATVNVRDIGNVVATDPAPRIVPTARLMEAAGQAEMKVSVKSDVGTVDVRAMLEGSNISATVAAQHSGTRDWLMSNIHELHTSLSRDDLNLKTFEVTDSGLQNSGNQGQPRQQEQQQRNNATYSNFLTETHSSTASLDDIEPQETTSRALSLLA